MECERPKAGDQKAVAHACSGRSPDPDLVPSGTVPQLVLHRLLNTRGSEGRSEKWLSNAKPLWP